MRILVLNGSPKKKSDTFRLTDAFLKERHLPADGCLFERLEPRRRA